MITCAACVRLLKWGKTANWLKLQIVKIYVILIPNYNICNSIVNMDNLLRRWALPLSDLNYQQ